MRKLLLLTLLLLSTAVQAQTILWDGESYSIGSRGGCWEDGTPTVVANLEQDGINPSGKCLQFTMTNSSKTVKIPFRDWMTPSMQGSRRVSLMIKKTTSENVLIELSDPTNGSGNYWERVATWYSGSGHWQKLVFDFSANANFDYPGVISITAQTANVDAAETVYIDNVMIEGVTRVNGYQPSVVGAASLRGALTLTGSWAKGKCSNANNNDSWQEISFDDFALLSTKLSSYVTSADLRQASVVKGRNVFAAANPNCVVFANVLFDEHISDNNRTATWYEPWEQGPMATWFTPQTGFVGDPMPFYDAQSHTFRILYLQDYRPNPDTYHPLHQINSADLSLFQYQGEAVSCGSLSSQDPALGTGSIIMKDGTYYLFYTGHKDNYNPVADESREVVMLATSTDGQTWTKDGSFILKGVSNGYDRAEFRDPHVFEYNGQYRMLVSTLLKGNPIVAQYTSSDLRSWTCIDPFFTDIYYASFYECPDVFKMGDYWYMIYSDQLDRKVHYRYSTSINGPWTFPVREGILDGTSFYAGKTAYDGYDRYLFGWCATRENQANDATQEWAGSLVVHKLYQNSDGTLSLTVPHTIDAKYALQTGAAVLGTTSGVVTTETGYELDAGERVVFERLKYQNKLLVDFTATSGSDVFGLALADCSDSNRDYRIQIDVANATLSYLVGGVVISQIPLETTMDGHYHLRVYTEQSVLVVYVNDRQALTSRIYGQSRNPWSIYSLNGTVSADEILVFTY